MISSFLRSTRNLSSVHSGSGSGCGPLRSSSDPGRGESALHSLLDPWSDCGKYPDKESHWAAMTLRYSFSRGQIIHGAARSSQQTLGASPREKFHVSSTEKSAAPPRNTSDPPLWFQTLQRFVQNKRVWSFLLHGHGLRNVCKIPSSCEPKPTHKASIYSKIKPLWKEKCRLWISFSVRTTVSGESSTSAISSMVYRGNASHPRKWLKGSNSGNKGANQTKVLLASGMRKWAPVQAAWNRSFLHL